MSFRTASTSIAPFVALLGLLVAGCGSNPVAPLGDVRGAGRMPPVLDIDRIQIQNDQALLDGRIERMSVPLSVRVKETPGRTQQQMSKPEDHGVRLTLVGEVHPPQVGDKVPQANDIEISGHTAVIGYNFAGADYVGAVQVIDFTHPDHPVVVSEVLYKNADVDAVELEGSHLYVGMQSGDPALSSPALLEELKLTGVGEQTTGEWLDLPSWAVTDLAVQGDRIVAGVGARDGGVALVERTGQGHLHLVGFSKEEDVRGVAVFDSKTAMAVCGGSAPMMSRHSLPDMMGLLEAKLDGYGNEDAKGTIEAKQGLCFLGAGDGGFQVREPLGRLVDALPNRAFSDVRPEYMVTNAVSVQGHLAFVAAGALGVQVVDIGHWSSDEGFRNLGDGRGLRVLGELDFHRDFSSNMVKAKENILVVAAGTGGVKLVKMEDVK